MKHIVKIEIDNKRYGIPEEVFNFIKQCCEKIQEFEDRRNKATKFIDIVLDKRNCLDNTKLEELKLDYSAVVTGYKKLEEENKKLKFAMQDTYDSANDTCGELQQRIDKIKEYIKQNEKNYGSLLDNEKVILKIIDGEENGNNGKK